MIKLNETLEYDKSISFLEQSEEVQEFVKEFMQSIAEEHFELQNKGLPKVPRLKTKRWYNEEMLYYVEEYYTYSHPYNHPQSGVHTTDITVIKIGE